MSQIHNSKIEALRSIFRDGDLVLLAGQPGSGKTSLTLSIAADAIKKGAGAVMYISLEHGRGAILRRLAGIKVCSGKDRARFFFFESLSAPTVEEIEGRVHHLADLQGKTERLALVVIDFVQLIRSSSYHRPRQEQLSGISQDLKRLARYLGIPILAVSQLGQAPRKPRLSDLRESRCFEKESAVTALLHRGKDNQVEITFAKGGEHGPS